MTRVNTKHIFFSLMLLILYLSCSSENRNDNFIKHKVKRTEFVNKITTSGIIEAYKTYTIACNGIWADMTITYLIPEGTYVNEGDTVCILECSWLKNNYQEAVKNLETAKAEYNNMLIELAPQR